LRKPICATALALDGLRVIGSLVLAPMNPAGDSDPSKDERWPTIKGSLELAGATVHRFVDGPRAWPEQEIKGANGKKLRAVITLDGFCYDRFGGQGLSAAARCAWLLRQPHEELTQDFRPHPWEQLIKVLREMGHEDDAKAVAVEKQRARRRARWGAYGRDFIRKLRHWWGWLILPFSLVFLLFSWAGLLLQWLFLDVLLGGGYAKIRPLLLFAVLLFGCALYYDWAARQGGLAPSNPVLFNNAEVRAACAGTAIAPDIAVPIDWYRCKRVPAEFNQFRPLVFSLDQMIPFVQLGQMWVWQATTTEIAIEPWGMGVVTLPAWTTQVVTWSQGIGSMLLYLLIAAILGGVIKRE